MSVVPHAQYRTVLSEMMGHLPKRATGVSPTLLRCRNSVTDYKKWSGSVGAERPTDPATGREFPNLLTKVVPDTQSLCVSAPGDEVHSSF